MIAAASGCDGFVCCVGCLSLVPGLIKRVVNQVAFFPPRPPGYHIDDKTVFLVDADYGLTPLPDFTNEGITVDTVRMRTRRGNMIYGFHFRIAPSTSSRPSPRCLLFSHGNSTDIGIMFPHLKDLCVKLEADVFAYEYSGYGQSTGVPTEADIYADIDAAYHYLTNDCGMEPHEVVLYGQSVGSVPSLDLAQRREAGGVILHSALKSGLGVIHEVKANYWFDVFRNLVKIRRVRCPVFVMHGTRDQEVPFEHGQALYEACPPSMAFDPWWVQEAGHNDIELGPQREMYFRHLLRFLRALDAPDSWSGRRDVDDEEEDGEMVGGDWVPLRQNDGQVYQYHEAGRLGYEPMSYH